MHKHGKIKAMIYMFFFLLIIEYCRKSSILNYETFFSRYMHIALDGYIQHEVNRINRIMFEIIKAFEKTTFWLIIFKHSTTNVTIKNVCSYDILANFNSDNGTINTLKVFSKFFMYHLSIIII